MWAKPVYTKRKSASAERCFRPLGAAFAIGSPVSSLVHRACRWAIVALAGTPRQLGWHVGYWAVWLTGNCCVWHKKHRLAGEVPHTSIDTEAAWSKSGYHGWWYGWKLHLAVVVGSVWIPLAAEFTIASDADNLIAPKLLEQLPLEVRYVLGDTHYNTPALREECALPNRDLVATRRGPYPHRDGGVEVRRIFHKLRSLAIEPFNGVCKNIFEWRGQMPVKGLKKCQMLALGAILLYQIVLIYQHQRQQPVGVGIKALLRAA